jgi:outer membrane murein-binding lipoprotein Lpp
MPVKKKRATTRKKKKGTSKLVSYTRKVYGNATVKSKTKKVNELERKLKAAKREKARAVKKVKAKIKKSKK